MIKIININVSHYLEMCYTKGINELSDFEIAVGIIGVYQEELLKVVSSDELVIVENFMNLKNGGTVDFSLMSETLFEWSKKWISETR